MAGLGARLTGVLLAAGFVGAAPAQAADITVTTTADTSGGGCASATDSCSLRQALARAQSGDTIILPKGTYALGEALRATRGGVKVDGEGARTTILDGGGSGRVLEVAAPGAITLEGVTLRNGEDRSRGGAAEIAEGASLTLVDATVSGNRAGGSGLEGSGGAVYNAGTLVLLRTLVAGNSAGATAAALGDGGAISNQGIFVATSSTFSGNAVGGSAFSGRGGAISTGADGRTTLVHVTIAGNSAGVSGAGGSLATAAGGTTVIAASIVAGGTGRVLTEDCDRAVTSRGANIAGGRTCGLTGPGDVQGVDPQLGPLTDAGGGSDVHPTAAGSPAIDAAPVDGCPPADQRGYVRTAGTGCDSGAFERDAAPAPEPSDFPPPVLGATFNLERVEGTVFIRRPGSEAPTRLVVREQVPIDTLVYALGGLASVTGETSPGGTYSHGEFFQGSFALVQSREARAGVAPVEVQLRGAGPDGCTPKLRDLKARRDRRGLWGRTKGGRFRTRGKYSAAAVRGTQWYTEDRCDGTLTRVVEGVVAVEDLPLKKTVEVSAGRDYLARPPRCSSRRTVDVTMPRRKGRRVRRESATAGGRSVRIVRGKAKVDLRGAPAGTFVVRLRVVLAGGKVLRDVRRYRTCEGG